GLYLAQALIDEATQNETLARLLRNLDLLGDGIIVTGTIENSRIPIPHRTALNLAALILAPISKAASRARKEATAAVIPGKGGARRSGRTPSSELVSDLIRIYFLVRRKYPASGSAKGYSPGGPLPRFVLAVFAAAV